MTIDGIKHHNPSGLHNKVLYLLSHSKWNKRRLEKLVDKIYINPKILKSCNSWLKAYEITKLILEGNIEELNKTRYSYWLKKPRVEEIE